MRHGNMQSVSTLPVMVGDYRYAQDVVRDFYYLRNEANRIRKILYGTSFGLVKGASVIVSGANQITVGPFLGYVKHDVEVIDSEIAWAQPPVTKTEEALAYVKSDVSQNILVGADHDKITPTRTLGVTNYLSIEYKEVEPAAAVRQRMKKAGTYNYETEDSHEFVLNSTDPSADEKKILLATVEFDGTNLVSVAPAAVTGDNNTVFGEGALSQTTTGKRNTALGTAALQSNTTGANNTAVGADALFSNINGTDNTAIGTAALRNNITGANNTALGRSALQSNTTGINNTAVGTSALFSNTTGSYNTALGANALYTNTTGISNTALGTSALYSNITGANNTAVGTAALRDNTIGTQNTALGSAALQSNTTGSNNTAIGRSALQYNTTGIKNTAIGTDALQSNTTGNENTAVGSEALRNNTTGEKNTAIGVLSLRSNTTGIENTAVGRYTGYANTTGNSNTFLGTSAGYANTTGNNNTFLGDSAGYTNTTGNNNIFLGEGTAGSSPTASNQITLGNTLINSLRCAVTTITSISDRRDKKNIEKLEIGLDFVKALNPCGWNYDLRENYPDGKSDGSKMKKERNHGFIAQDLQEIQKKFKIDLGLVMDDNPDKLETSEGRLLPVIVKAIQELSERLEKLEGGTK